MDPMFIAVICLCILFILMFLGMPVGFAMLLVGFTGLGFLTSMYTGLSILSTNPFVTASTYMFSVLPLFILMGLIAHEGGLTSELYSTCHKLVGHVPGGLAIATVWGCAAFAAITGESLAASLIMSKIALPEMRKYKYDIRLATGTIASGGTLGILIPPSAGFILYGIITGANIGKLFIAGILPGILLSLLFTISIYARVKYNPRLAMKAPRAPWKEMVYSLKSVLPIFVVFLMVIGGIYMGIFTPTEAGSVGVFLAFILVIIKGKLTWRGLVRAFRDTIQSTGMVFVILIGAMVFNYLLATSRLPMELSELVLKLELSRYIIFLLIVALLLVLGCVMDVPAMILLTMPILFPIVTDLGFDPIWFGVISVIISEAGAVTPPVGMNVYVMSSVVNDVPLFDIFRGIWPFLGMMVLCIIILTIFPQICLFLPDLMK